MSQETRRSQRIRAITPRRPPIETITISSSSEVDEDELQVVKEVITPSKVSKPKSRTTKRGRPPKRPIDYDTDTQSTIDSRISPLGRDSNSSSATNVRQRARHTPNLDRREKIAAKKVSSSSSNESGGKKISDTGYKNKHHSPVSTSRAVLDEFNEGPHGGSPIYSAKHPASVDSLKAHHLRRLDLFANQTVSSQTPIFKGPNLDLESLEERVRKRRFVVDKIIGAIRPKDGIVEFVIRCKGLTQLQRMSLDELKVICPSKLVEFMCGCIRWERPSDRGPSTTRKPQSCA